MIFFPSLCKKLKNQNMGVLYGKRRALEYGQNFLKLLMPAGISIFVADGAPNWLWIRLSIDHVNILIENKENVIKFVPIHLVGDGTICSTEYFFRQFLPIDKLIEESFDWYHQIFRPT